MRWWFFAVAWCGCGPDDPDEFEAAFADVWCERQEQCALGDFERDWTSMEECVADRADDPHLPDDDQGCDIDDDGVDRCLEYLRETDCAGFEGKEIEEACRDAYAC
jgi:hypothetical protein